MASYNKVILMGNLTRDPELRYTPNGAALVKFGVAVSRRSSGTLPRRW
jgi:single-strand DNA-binding protein